MSKEEKAKELAESRGISIEEARQIIDQVFGSDKPPTDPHAKIKEEFGIYRDMVGDITSMKDKLDPATATMLSRFAAEKIGQLDKGQDDDFDEDMKKMMKYFGRVRMLTSVLDSAAGERGGRKSSGVDPDAIAKSMREEMKPLQEAVVAISSKIANDEKSEMWGMINELKEVFKGTGGGNGPTKALTDSEIMEKANQIKETTRKALQDSGYIVQPAFVAREDLPDAIRKLDPATLKPILEQQGFKIQGGPIPWQQHEDELKAAVAEVKKERVEDANAERAGQVVEKVAELAFKEVIGPMVRLQAAPQPQQNQQQPPPETPPPDQKEEEQPAPGEDEASQNNSYQQQQES